MRIKEEFKRLGYFWLPSAPDKPVPGTLLISDGGIIELEVVHLVGGRSASLGDDAKRIVGQIETDNFVTLDHCSYKNPGGSGGILTQSFNVERAFTGVTYKEDESPRFNTLTFSVEGTDEWIGISYIEADLQLEKGIATISYELLGAAPINLDNGMQLLIAPSLTFDGVFSVPKETTINPKAYFKKEATVIQKTDFKLVSQEMRALDEFISVAQKITTFLCFAINEIVCLDSMSATSDDHHKDIEEGTTRPYPKNIYCPSWPFSKDEPKVNPSNILFGYQEMPNDAEKMINKWIEIYEQIEPALDLYFLAKMGAQPSSKAKFLALTQSLEACHRRINGGKESFGERLENIIEPFKDIIGNETTQKKLISRVVNTRNYLTHYDRRLESKAAKDEDLPLLCLKMESLFQLHILRLIDFSIEQINAMVAHRFQSIVWEL